MQRGKRSRDDEILPVAGRPVLLPPIVTDYFPYTRGQLSTVKARQMKHCAQQWDRYYSSNTVNGYKDRHYILREFPELHAALDIASASSGEQKAEVGSSPQVVLLEIGCGVGNAVIPMLDEYKTLGNFFVVYGFDISAVAVELLLGKARASESLRQRLFAIPFDLTEQPMTVGPWLPQPVSFATIIFVLCSVPKDKQQCFVDRVASLVAEGGTVFIRDYCSGDLAEKRFEEERRVDDSTFLRTNGTLSHFFTAERLRALFVGNGYFEVVSLSEICRDVENRKEEVTMSRRFVQGRFRRTGKSNND